MTCKDCKDFSTCEYEFKSLEYSDDGDSVANHCDDFNSIHYAKEIVKDGIVVHQAPRGGIYAFDEKTDELIYHVPCYEMKTDEELERTVDFIKNQLPGWILDSNENHYSFCDGCQYESFYAPHCTAGDDMRECCLSSIQRWLESEAET